MKRLIHFLVRRYLPNEGKYIETRIQASSKFYAILLIKKEDTDNGIKACFYKAERIIGDNSNR